MVLFLNYLAPEFTEADVGKISILGLAFIGDGVYEILVRTWLLTQAHTAALDLHRKTVGMVNAGAQAEAYKRIADTLSEDEQAVYRRGRNAKVNQVPHNASPAEYHSATGLEALFGYLYLNGKQARINELFALITSDEMLK